MLPTIIENIPQLIFWKDTEGVFLGCNTKFAKSLGLDSPQDIIGKNDYDVTDAENARHFIETDKKVISDNIAIFQERQTMKNAQGHQLWLNIHKVPLHDENNQIIGVLGTMEDITAQVNLEQKLRNNNIKYKSLIESTNTAYMILNESLEIMEANNIFMKLLNSDSLYACLGKPISLWIAPKFQEIFIDAFNGLFKGDAINDLEMHLVTEKDEIVCVSINANIIENGDIKIFCLVRNIAARKAVESEKYIKKEKKRDKLKQDIANIKQSLNDDITEF
jgi:two-component system cell cycle sensor histidine kinase/response regulator CckA